MTDHKSDFKTTLATLTNLIEQYDFCDILTMLECIAQDLADTAAHNGDKPKAKQYTEIARKLYDVGHKAQTYDL